MRSHISWAFLFLRVAGNLYTHLCVYLLKRLFLTLQVVVCVPKNYLPYSGSGNSFRNEAWLSGFKYLKKHIII